METLRVRLFGEPSCVPLGRRRQAAPSRSTWRGGQWSRPLCRLYRRVTKHASLCALVGPLRDRVGGDAVQADRREQERHAAEEPREARDRALSSGLRSTRLPATYIQVSYPRTFR